MEFPAFMTAFPSLDLPLSEDIVSTHALRTEQGLAVFFEVHQDFTLPPHAHKAQWGTVLAGEMDLTMDGQTRTIRPGDTYSIPAGTEHGVSIKAGTRILDVFEEPDRYPLKA